MPTNFFGKTSKGNFGDRQLDPENKPLGEKEEALVANFGESPMPPDQGPPVAPVAPVAPIDPVVPTAPVEPIVDQGPPVLDDQESIKSDKDPIEGGQEAYENLKYSKSGAIDISGSSDDLKEKVIKFTETSDRVSSRLKSDLVGLNEEASTLNSDLLQAMGDAKKAYEKTKKKEESKQLWEGIIHSVGYLLAGIIGYSENVALDGLTFSKTDWASRSKGLMDELNQSTDAAYKSMSAKEREITTRRASTVQEFNIQAADIDRAFKNEKAGLDMQIRLKEQAEKKLEAINKAFKGSGKETPEQKAEMALFKTYVNDLNDATKMFLKKDNEKNGEHINLMVKQVNNMSLKVMGKKLYANDNPYTRKGGFGGWFQDSPSPADVLKSMSVAASGVTPETQPTDVPSLVEKAAVLPVGTVRNRNGVPYEKTAQGWKPVK